MTVEGFSLISTSTSLSTKRVLLSLAITETDYGQWRRSIRREDFRLSSESMLL